MSALRGLGVAAIVSIAAAGQSQETKTVSVQTLSVFDILYVLKGGGGNSLALMRDDGVVLIDTKLAGWGKPVLDAINAVSDKPVTTIINTNAEPSHVGANAEFSSAAQVIAHQATRDYMAAMEIFRGPNSRFLPNQLVNDKLSILDGSDRIDLYYFGPGCTKGDLIVVFPEKHVAYFGDLFPAKAAPFIDPEKGGSVIALAETLAKAEAQLKGINRVVSGQDIGSQTSARQRPGAAIFANPLTLRWADFQEYVEFNHAFLNAVREAKQSGKSADEAAAALNLPEKYKEYDMRNARSNVESIYNELNKPDK